VHQRPAGQHDEHRHGEVAVQCPTSRPESRPARRRAPRTAAGRPCSTRDAGRRTAQPPRGGRRDGQSAPARRWPIAPQSRSSPDESSDDRRTARARCLAIVRTPYAAPGRRRRLSLPSSAPRRATAAWLRVGAGSTADNALTIASAVPLRRRVAERLIAKALADTGALLMTLLAVGGLGLGAMFTGMLTHLTGAADHDGAAGISGLFNTTTRAGGVLGTAASARSTSPSSTAPAGPFTGSPPSTSRSASQHWPQRRSPAWRSADEPRPASSRKVLGDGGVACLPAT
jgi:hypothetical protein